LTRELDTEGAEPGPLAVPREELAAALARADPALVAALELAAANVREVAAAAVGADDEVALSQGQRVRMRELPVRRAALYVPGGRAPYPSTVVMGAVTARVAGVEDVVVCAPPGSDGRVHDAILAACAVCGVSEVYAMGGAQAVAALAYGTETVPSVDVVVGPGSVYVQEAKRQVAHRVGIEGFAGPSELVVVLDDAEAAGDVALDLLAQAEHGPDSPVVALSPIPAALDAIAAAVEAAPGPDEPAARLLDAPDLEAALAFAEAFAPEHLQLVGPGAEALAERVSTAGCLFVGRLGGTAFGDYVAGSNHVLPTGGAARFASVLSPRHFRRRMSEVRLAPGAGLAELARAGATIARTEGFVRHAESMEARMGENQAT
ncbi:MAG TPA: histidinol dehydrogenase, partial [Solirubrobacteraceae bacterium]|nr:histidinol dehydrogenase [Solirubrobacteraceae bacterium]